jgi:hypothetical protein
MTYTFLKILIFIFTTSLTIKASDSEYTAQINGAFGIRLGDVFDKDRAIGTRKLESGETLYVFRPSKPYLAFNTYYALLSPKTDIIYEIWATGKYENKANAERELSLLKSILGKKYGKGEGNDFVVRGDINYIYQGDREITLRIKGFTNFELRVIYTDVTLKKQAEKVKHEILASKRETGGL